jgi:hypothetical protein
VDVFPLKATVHETSERVVGKPSLPDNGRLARDPDTIPGNVDNCLLTMALLRAVAAYDESTLIRPAMSSGLL